MKSREINMQLGNSDEPFNKLKFTVQACKRMTPGHGFDPQDGDPPVTLQMSSRSDISPGGHVDVELVSPDSFKGFILQARNAEDGETPVGNFETEEASFMTCGKGIHNSITHRNSQPKTSVKARSDLLKMQIRFISSN